MHIDTWTKITIILINDVYLIRIIIIVKKHDLILGRYSNFTIILRILYNRSEKTPDLIYFFFIKMSVHLILCEYRKSPDIHKIIIFIKSLFKIIK